MFKFHMPMQITFFAGPNTTNLTVKLGTCNVYNLCDYSDQMFCFTHHHHAAPLAPPALPHCHSLVLAASPPPGPPPPQQPGANKRLLKYVESNIPQLVRDFMLYNSRKNYKKCICSQF